MIFDDFVYGTLMYVYKKNLIFVSRVFDNMMNCDGLTRAIDGEPQGLMPQKILRSLLPYGFYNVGW